MRLQYELTSHPIASFSNALHAYLRHGTYGGAIWALNFQRHVNISLVAVLQDLRLLDDNRAEELMLVLVKTSYVDNIQL